MTVKKINQDTIDYIFNDDIKKPVVKVSWSGGKDSTCSVIQHTLDKHKCIIVAYIPELIENIPLITKEHNEFICNTAKIFESWGHEVHILHGISYYDLFHEQITRGKNKGKMKGYSLGFGFCKFRDLSKIKTLQEFTCDYDYEDIGIAYDEIKRQSQLTDIKRSILVEKGITEDIAKYICKKFGLLSSHYNTNTRDGCAICPNATKNELNRYLQDYPEAKEILLNLDIEYNTLYALGKIKGAVNGKIFPYRQHETFTDRIIKRD